MSLDTDVEAIAARQHGLFTHRQARAAGASEDATRHRCRTGRWIRHRRGVYRLLGAPVTPRLELLAAVLGAPGSVASHTSAASLLGLPGFSVLPAHISIRSAPRSRLATIVHASWALPPQHLRAVDAIRCTSVARTLFDLCGLVSPGRAERALDTALARSMTTIPALQRVLEDLARRGRGGTAIFREMLAARGAGYIAPESELEQRFVALAREHDLPEPVRQIDLGDADGWIGRVDFAFPSGRLVVEVDGRLAHSSLLDRRADTERDHRLTAAGWTVRRFSWADVTGSPAAVAAEVRRALVLAA
jgi:very-short-patch-repair endonuclease